MKHIKSWFTLILIGVLLLTAWGCQKPPANVTEPPTTGATEATETVPTVTAPPATEDYVDIYGVRREPDEIYVYPFTEAELEAALEIVEENQRSMTQEPGTLTYEVEKIAFDPIMTDVHALCRMKGAPVEGWTEEDYYRRRISFAVTFSATFDHTKTFRPDVEHTVIDVTLERESEQSPWTYFDGGVPVEKYSDRAMSAGELKNIADTGGRALAGYQVGDAYWLYSLDSTGKVQFVQKDL